MIAVLPLENLERAEAWGQATFGMAYVFRPSTVSDLMAAFDLARESGVSIGLRGAGRSYGDASINSEGILVDLTRMNRVLDWDPEAGVIDLEPGVTIEQLWRYVLGDGWWPAVVPGTMAPTVGGCLAMNVHGKNNWHEGPLGEHVLEFEALLPTGDRVVCSPSSDPELFHGMIGGRGVLGCFTRIKLQLKRVHSGQLDVLALSVPTIDAMLTEMDALKDDWEYVVGWVDCFAGSGAVGRGQIHVANHLPAGADPAPVQSLRLDHQDLPDTFFGLMPKSILWRFMKPFANNFGWRMVCLARYLMAKRGHGHRFLQSLAEFNFLLDYVPHWKRAYWPQGLIQYQCFIPRAEAAEAFAELLNLCNAMGLPSYLGVTKRHRPDDFLLSHAVDGFSLAMDFRVTARNRQRLLDLTQAMDDIVLAHSGRFYFAKDSTIMPETAREYLGEDALARLMGLKARCDPEGLLQTDLWRRVFFPAAANEEFHNIARGPKLASAG
jgi:decaprenylphospho-beta-D-ribofuranose 2-oxidase